MKTVRRKMALQSALSGDFAHDLTTGYAFAFAQTENPSFFYEWIMSQP